MASIKTQYVSWEIIVLLLMGSFISLPANLFAQGTRFSNNPMIGMIDGKPVFQEDIRDKRIQDSAQALYDSMQANLMQHAIKQLALKHKELQVEPQIKVSDEEVKLFYQQNNLKTRGPLTQLKNQIREYLEQQNQVTHILTQYQLAKRKGWVASYLQPPTEFLLTASAETSFLRGNPKASVMVLEFSDYQCPFCNRIQPTLRSLINKYKDKVAFAYRHFPLAFHKEADEAAIAAECAGEQGKFGEMHFLLYNNQRSQFPSDLKQYARQLKVQNLKKFDRCLDQEKYRGKVNQDINVGKKLGINGTPGFMIGIYHYKTKTIQGEIISGAQPREKFEQLIQKYLNRKS